MQVKKTKDSMTASLARMKKEIANLPKEAYDFWVSVTPEDTGNAKRKTKLQDKTIVADYKYAQRLDKGWSKQAPKGMVEPTEKFIQRRLRQKVRK